MNSTHSIQKILSFGIALAASLGITSAEVVGDNKNESHGIIPAAGASRKPPLFQDLNPAFGPDLYRQLRTNEGNVFFSPYSISEAMGMVYLGSGSNTSTEIAKALSFSQDTKMLGPIMLGLRHQLMAHINQKDNKLNIANALCITGKSPLQSYQDSVRQQYDGEIFSGDVDKINGWVKKKTEGNIEKILDQLSDNSVCVILNAVYFKGTWKDSFNANHTQKADFHLASGKTTQVDMMHREGSFKVLRDKGLIAVELPYQTSASMVLIMPEKAEGMKALEDSLNHEMIQTLCKNLQGGKDERATLFMPKFKLATSYNLVEPMKQLGMIDAFNAKADFKAIYTDPPVNISQIKHKATLEVDEMGSVASAVAAVDFQEASAFIEEPVPQIRFDRPFLVLIRENNSGTNLFMGRINDPTAK